MPLTRCCAYGIERVESNWSDEIGQRIWRGHVDSIMQLFFLLNADHFLPLLRIKRRCSVTCAIVGCTSVQGDLSFSLCVRDFISRFPFRYAKLRSAICIPRTMGFRGSWRPINRAWLSAIAVWKSNCSDKQSNSQTKVRTWKTWDKTWQLLYILRIV